MATAFIAIPKKKTYRVDWVKPLSGFITSEYGKEMMENHRIALNDLQQLRDNIQNSSDVSEAALSDLLKYVGLMSSIMMRFPVSEDQVRVQFYWCDIFKGQKTQNYSAFYEQANVLFNVGAVYSNIAASQNVALDEGLKAAAGYFQKAAGVFESLKRDIEAHPQASNDLRGDALSALISLNLAQAQECFFLKAANANFNASILAKLAQAAADMFDKTTLQLDANGLKNLVDSSWPIQTRLKSCLYQAHVLKMLSDAEENAKRFGSQVGLLRAATMTLKDAEKKNLTKRAPANLTTAFKSLQTTIHGAAAAAEGDNDLIYNEPVPETLPTAEAKAMVKAQPFVNDTQFQDPFAQLVPFAVRHAASVYVDRRQAAVMPVLAACDDHNDLLKATLASLSLPGALDALDNPKGVPAPLIERANEVRRNGGIGQLLTLFERRDELAARNKKLLTNALQSLDDEEARDKAASNGMRTPSHALNAGLRQEAAKYTQNQEHASKSDALVRVRFEKINDDLMTLSGAPKDLEASLPAAPSVSDSVDRSAVTELRRVLGLLDALVERRQTARQKLLSISDNDNITSKLVLGGDFESVYKQELKKYEPLMKELNDTYSEQTRLMQDLTKANDRFVSSRSGAGGGAREAALQRLDVAARAFSELYQNLQEGIQFHTSFAALLETFNSKCEQFVNNRDAELAQMSMAQAQTYQPSIPQASYPNYQQQQQQQMPYGQVGYAPAPPQYGQPQQQPPQYGQQPGYFNPYGGY